MWHYILIFRQIGPPCPMNIYRNKFSPGTPPRGIWIQDDYPEVNPLPDSWFWSIFLSGYIKPPFIWPWNPITAVRIFHWGTSNYITEILIPHWPGKYVPYMISSPTWFTQKYQHGFRTIRDTGYTRHAVTTTDIYVPHDYTAGSHPCISWGTMDYSASTWYCINHLRGHIKSSVRHPL